MSRRPSHRRHRAGGAELRPVLLSVVRRPTGLVALVSTPIGEGLCRTRAVPLADVPVAVCPQRDELIALWAALEDHDLARAAAHSLAERTRAAWDVRRPDPALVTAALRAVSGDPRPVEWRRALQHPVVVRALAGRTVRESPLLREQAAGAHRSFRTAWHRLDLEHEPGLRDQVLAFVARRSRDVWTPWLELLPHVHPSLRESVLMAILDLRVLAAPTPAHALLTSVHDCGDARFVVAAAAAGLRPDEVGAGLALGVVDVAEQVRNHRLRRIVPRPAGWATALLEWSAAVDEQDGEPSRWGAWLWLRCLNDPLLCELVARRDWAEHDPDVVHALVTVLDTEGTDARWRHGYQELIQTLRDTPAEGRLRLVQEFTSIAVDSFASPRARPAAVEIARLAVRHSTSRETRTAVALAALADAASRLGTPRRAFELPTESLALVEDACRTHGRAERLEKGLQVLGRLKPEALLAAAERYPRALFRAARALGSLSTARAAQVVRTAPPAAVPMPRRMRLALEGRVTLSAAAAEGHRRRMETRQLAAEVASWRAHAIAAAMAGLPLSSRSDADVHAAQMAAGPKENRRALRRFLRAGCPAPILHARNAAWLRARPRVDVRALDAGPIHEVQLPEHGPVRLAIETRPLEALRLGSHVGTCLGLGGFWAEYAAAWVLDVNKRVVYARRGDGHVVARQAVAVDDEERVYLGTVYPRSVAHELACAFLEWDLAWAERLALPLAPNDFELRGIVAGSFFGDGVWDVVAPTG